MGWKASLCLLGVKVRRRSETIELQASSLTSAEPPYELVNGLRASFFAIGSILARMGYAKVPFPADAASVHDQWSSTSGD